MQFFRTYVLIWISINSDDFQLYFSTHRSLDRACGKTVRHRHETQQHIFRRSLDGVDTSTRACPNHRSDEKLSQSGPQVVINDKPPDRGRKSLYSGTVRSRAAAKSSSNFCSLCSHPDHQKKDWFFNAPNPAINYNQSISGNYKSEIWTRRRTKNRRPAVIRQIQIRTILPQLRIPTTIWIRNISQQWQTWCREKISRSYIVVLRHNRTHDNPFGQPPTLTNTRHSDFSRRWLSCSRQIKGVRHYTLENQKRNFQGEFF